ncbi:MAG: RIP metalloprotease RseP [Fusicatenibacter sp.]
MIVKILIAVLIFGLTVIIHELGHFLLAKANHITVTEFSIGFGPTIVKTEKGGTVYSLKLLPFGGACQMLGEDGEEEGEGTFNSKSVGARIAVVAAGPMFNLFLAFCAAVIVISYAGSAPARVTEVAEGSPEEAAGLMAGDVITEYEGKHISLGKELSYEMNLRGIPVDEITLEIERDGEKKTITYQPVTTTKYMMGFNYDDSDRGLEITYVQQGMPMAESGILAGDILKSLDGTKIANMEEFQACLQEHPLSTEPVTVGYEHSGIEKEAVITPVENTYASVGFGYQLREKQPPLGVLKYSFLEVKYWVKTVIESVGMLLTGQYSVNDLSGPVGVVDTIGTVYDDVKSQGVLVTFMTMLNMVILLSSNLGVMNLLPLPALDGGRLVFLVIEAIRRKPVKRDVEGMIHFAGLVLLMVLMVYVMIHDVQRIL